MTAYSTTALREAEIQRVWRNARLAQVLFMSAMLAWLVYSIWAGVRITWLEHEVELLDTGLLQCLAVVDQAGLHQ